MSRSLAARFLAILMLAVALTGTFAGDLLAQREVPFLSGRVQDEAGILSPAARQRIEASLARIEQESGAQIAVLTVPSLDGENVEDYALRVAETWKLGREAFDDGALLLIAPQDRKMRLEVGYGLEPLIPDIIAGRILNDVIAPRFRQGDFDGGIEAAVEAIAGRLRGEEALPPPSAGGDGGSDFFIFLLPLFFFGSSAIANRKARGLGIAIYLISLPFGLFLLPHLIGPLLSKIGLAVWLIGFPALWSMIFARRPHVPRSGPGSWSSTGRRGGGGFFGGGGFGGGGFSGGGFSGGGGSFGGGGASSSW